VSAFVRYTIALLLAYFLTWTASYTYTVFNAVGHLDFATYFPNYFLWPSAVPLETWPLAP
jgi:hypothetical protein